MKPQKKNNKPRKHTVLLPKHIDPLGKWLPGKTKNYSGEIGRVLWKWQTSVSAGFTMA